MPLERQCAAAYAASRWCGVPEARES